MRRVAGGLYRRGGRLRAYARLWLAFAIAAVVAILALQAPAHAQTAAASTVKAAFLYNFAKFTEWPADALAPGQRIALCVVGDGGVADALELTIKGRLVDGRELTVQVLEADGPIRSCHLLYVDGRDSRRSAQLLERLKATPILSVSDAERFADRGGIAQLVLERDRMRFAINVTAAERSRLRLSSKLLSLARVIREEP